MRWGTWLCRRDLRTGYVAQPWLSATRTTPPCALPWPQAVKVVGGADAYSEWEGGSNHVLLIPDSTTTSSLAVRVEWGAGTAVLDEAGRKKVGPAWGCSKWLPCLGLVAVQAGMGLGCCAALQAAGLRLHALGPATAA